MANSTPEGVVTHSRFSTTIPLDHLTPKYLKDNYHPGIKLTGSDNQELSDDWYNEQIANAIDKVESFTNVDILERSVKSEKHDYAVTDYTRYGFLQLYRVPSRSVQEVRAVYPTGNNIQIFPPEWIRLNQMHSQINLVPTAGSLSQVIIGQGADFIPLIFAKLSYLPHLWEVDYVSGFDPEAIPRLVIESICKYAIMDIFTTMSDTIYPLGIGSQSLSIDGLSQSRSFSMPAFKARVDRYTADLGLPGTPSEKSGLINQIRSNYLGINLASL